MNLDRLYQVIVAPVVSEKATNVAEKNRQFVFRVMNNATKLEIKSAVEHIFKVNVLNVQVSNVKPKLMRRGRFVGKHKGWKKAYVAIQRDQDIDYANI